MATALDLATVPTGPFTPTDLHARLARLRGRWQGTARTYLDPTRPDAAEVAPWSGTIDTLLGGRFLRFTYTSSAMGQPIAGELTVAHESGEGRVRMAWIDSFHTSPAILVSEGPVSEGPVSEGAPPSASAPIAAQGSYFAGEGHPRWGWRTEFDDSIEGALRIRMTNITPGGEEAIGVEIELTRAG